MNRGILTMIALIVLACVGAVEAEIVSRSVVYKHGEVELTGYIAFDDAIKGKRPGVLIVHEWWGLNDYAKNRAKMLAELGYVAFCADIYGTGKVTTDAAQAKEWAMAFYGDVALWRARVQSALATLKDQPEVDGERIGAIGYCFGGASVLHLAISGADVDAVVSFHGALPVVTEGAKIKASVLVCHGAADPFIKTDEMLTFIAGMNASGADWQMHSYGGAVHSFTNREADHYGIEGAGYNKAADERSWSAMQELFKAKLTGADGAAAEQKLEFVVDARGAVSVNGERRDPAELARYLRRFSKDTKVVIRADAKTPYDEVGRLMNEIKAAGFENIAIVQGD